MNKYPQRKSPRYAELDYNEGVYFITICTQDKVHYFGEIVDHKMVFTPLGKFVDEELQNLGSHYDNVEVTVYTVMPNHIHAIIYIDTINKQIPVAEDRVEDKLNSTSRTLLSSVVSSFKAGITRFANRNRISFKWQSRYYDHTIRNVKNATAIGEYIMNNVAKWHYDEYK